MVDREYSLSVFLRPMMRSWGLDRDAHCLFNSAEPQDERAPSAGAKSLAIPFDQGRWTPIEHGKTKCVGCGQDAKRWTMFGRSY